MREGVLALGIIGFSALTETSSVVTEMGSFLRRRGSSEAAANKAKHLTAGDGTAGQAATGTQSTLVPALFPRPHRFALLAAFALDIPNVGSEIRPTASRSLCPSH